MKLSKNKYTEITDVASKLFNNSFGRRIFYFICPDAFEDWLCICYLNRNGTVQMFREAYSKEDWHALPNHQRIEEILTKSKENVHTNIHDEHHFDTIDDMYKSLKVARSS
jgi:hypothetical protein